MKTLLVIDRRTRTRHELSGWLGVHHEVIAARNVFSAFRYLRTRRIDTVVVKTASWDGVAIAVLKWLQFRGMGVPVVVLLGADAAAEMRLVRGLGASAVLRWPTSRAKLLETVASVCANGDSELRLPPASIRHACD